MTREWQPSDTYVCGCGHCCSSYRLGKQHEQRCIYCQQELRGEEDKEEDEDEPDDEDEE